MGTIDVAFVVLVLVQISVTALAARRTRVRAPDVGLLSMRHFCTFNWHWMIAPSIAFHWHRVAVRLRTDSSAFQRCHGYLPCLRTHSSPRPHELLAGHP